MFDLSKLKALEFPKREIEVEILGEKQHFTVRAYGDAMLLDLADIRAGFPETAERRWRHSILLTCVDGMTEEGAGLLLERAGEASVVILNEIFNLSDEFNKAREKITEEAEKNLPAAAAGTMRI